MRNMKFESKDEKMLFAQADMVSTILFGCFWADCLQYFKSFIELYCCDGETKLAFLGLMIAYNNLYMKTIKSTQKKVDDWRHLFYFVLTGLISHGAHFLGQIVEKFGDQFFQTLGNNRIDWLIDTLSQNSGSKDQRIVAIAIVNYVLCTASKPKEVMTKKLVQYVNDVLDLQWELAQT